MRFRVLNGWRGICALLVALYHFHVMSHASGLALVRNAWLFVDFFFVLSGFVVTHAYGGRIDSARSKAGFVLRRFGRLWPLHAAMIGTLVLLEIAKPLMAAGLHRHLAHQPFTGPHSIEALVLNAALLHSLGTLPYLSWNNPSWSISVEFYTYLAFVMVDGIAPARLKTPVAAGLVAICFTILCKYSPWYLNATFDYGIFRCVLGFMLGVIVRRLWSTTQPQFGMALGTAWELASIAAVVAYVSCVPAHSPFTMAAPILFAVVILVFAWESGIPSCLLGLKLFQLGGEWSYSIYMVHFVLLMIVLPFMPRIPDPDGRSVAALGNVWFGDLAGILYVIAVLAISSVTFRAIERPWQQRSARLAKRIDTTNPYSLSQKSADALST